MLPIDASKTFTGRELADLYFSLKGPSERRLARIVEHTGLPGRAVIRAVAVRYAENWARETFPDRSLPRLQPEDIELNFENEDD